MRLPDNPHSRWQREEGNDCGDCDVSGHAVARGKNGCVSAREGRRDAKIIEDQIRICQPSLFGEADEGCDAPLASSAPQQARLLD